MCNVSHKKSLKRRHLKTIVLKEQLFMTTWIYGYMDSQDFHDCLHSLIVTFGLALVRLQGI